MRSQTCFCENCGKIYFCKDGHKCSRRWPLSLTLLAMGAIVAVILYAAYGALVTWE